MSNESLGPIQVVDTSPFAINDALRQLVDRIDEVKGLRGRAAIFDRVQVSDPEELTDAVNLGTSAGTFVTLATDQNISGEKTFLAPARFVLPVRYVDSGGHLIHAFGTIA